MLLACETTTPHTAHRTPTCMQKSAGEAVALQRVNVRVVLATQGLPTLPERYVVRVHEIVWSIARPFTYSWWGSRILLVKTKNTRLTTHLPEAQTDFKVVHPPSFRVPFILRPFDS